MTIKTGRCPQQTPHHRPPEPSMTAIISAIPYIGITITAAFIILIVAALPDWTRRWFAIAVLIIMATVAIGSGPPIFIFGRNFP